MTDILTAGERLAQSSQPSRPARSSKPPEKPGKGRGRPSLFGAMARVLRAVMVLAVIGGTAAGVAGYVLYKRFSAELPDITALKAYQPRVMSRVYASDNRLLAELATERRIFVPYEAIPERVRQAFVSAEDQNFFLHRGIDPLAIARAAITDLAQYGQGRRPIGASTITQQVAKNMLLGNEVSLSRKAREALLALRIEANLSKERILELYLNEIYLGLQSYGVAAAAQAYFNKPLDELTIAEAAFLAALPKAPNNYNPFRFPDAAKARRDFVIDRMAADRAITPEQAAEAKASPVEPSAFRRPETLAGGEYFTEEVRRWLVEHFGADRTTQGGLVVRTTLDPVLQPVADRVVREGLIRYDQRRGGWRGPVTQIPGGPGLRSAWPTALAGVDRPRGMLPTWRLAVVVEETDAEAKLGLLDKAAGQPAGAPPAQVVLPLSLSDLAWARPNKSGTLGPAPKRLADVVQPGDVVMVERVPGVPAQGGSQGGSQGAAQAKTPARPEHLLLRQIPQVQGALVSIDPATGRVLAMSGGWSFDSSQFNRVTQAWRQPGSSFKPFVYLTALEAGISPSQRFLDAPFVVDQGAAGKWRPGNFELDFNGPVPLRVALEKSLNLVTVRVADRVGMGKVADNAIAFHVVDAMPRVLPAALGAVDTTVLRQAAAYAGLAMGGREVTPTLIDSVQDQTGQVVWRPEGIVCAACADPDAMPQLDDQRRQIADPQSTFQLVTMMQGVVQRGTGTPAGAGLNRAIAGKTGTTQDFNDAWFVGFTPDLVTAVWVGFDTPTTLGNNETGGANAAPIWHDFMAAALRDRPKLTFPQPEGVTMASWESGFGTVTDAFKPGQEPGVSGPLVGRLGGGGGGNGGGDAPSGGGGGGGASTGGGVAAGVDTGLGGLY